jgi:CRP-like cAMP-binding protein
VPTAHPADRSRNRLLDALPDVERDRWFGQLVPSYVEIRTVLFEPGQVVESVYFPLNAVIALVTPLHEGALVEVATVGNEGIVGVPLVPRGSLAVRAIAQVAGWVLPMVSTAFLKAIKEEAAVRELVEDYVEALFGQIAQAAACNRRHSNEERLSRWLLMSQDRVGVDEFAVTHEFLGQLLGSRRATVTLSAHVLQAAGLIRYRRGQVTIVDRRGLETMACECYRVIKVELDGVLDRAVLRGRGEARPASRSSPEQSGAPTP